MDTLKSAWRKAKPKPKVAAGLAAGSVYVVVLAIVDELTKRGVAAWLAALVAVAVYFGAAWLKRD